MASVSDLISALQLLDPSKEIGNISQYTDLIRKSNLRELREFIGDAREIARILDDLVKPEVSYGYGSFIVEFDGSIVFDDGEGGYDFYCEIQIDRDSRLFRVATDVAGVSDVSPTFSSVQEVADFLNEEWGCSPDQTYY
jgi:hypothetical protein